MPLGKWERCGCRSLHCKREYPTEIGTFCQGTGFDPEEKAEIVQAFEAAARVEALERACGAAAIAMALDTLHLGVRLRDVPENSPTRMACEAVGIDIRNPDDLIRFRNEYMARFNKEGVDHG